MYLFDKDKKLKQYTHPHEIIDDFFDVRMQLYEDRLSHTTKVTKMELSKLQNQIRFIQSVYSKEFELAHMEEESLDAELSSRGFERFGSDDELDKSYQYLLKLPLLSLTKSNADRLENQLSKLIRRVDELSNTSAEDLWRRDLNALEVELTKSMQRQQSKK